MRNLKIILSVAIIAALAMSFAACGDPEPDPDASWTVTFDANGGFFGPVIANASAKKEVSGIADQGQVTAPSDVYKAWTPQAGTTASKGEGLYLYLEPTAWNKADGKAFDFAKDKVTADITLKAAWGAERDKVASLSGSGSIVEKAVSTVKANPKPYVLALANDVTDVGGVSKLDVSYAQLLIVGIGGNKKIVAPTTKGRIFVVGHDSDKISTIALTLGSNITLQGITNNTDALVLVQNNATLTMSTGSSITGNSSDGTSWQSWSNNHGFGVAGVHVDGATLSMQGGTITGNTNIMSGTKAGNNDATPLQIGRVHSAGGVYVEANGTVDLVSGSISGNSNNIGAADIFSTAGSATLINQAKFGGTSAVGEIGLGGNDTHLAKITVSPDYNPTAKPKIFLQGTEAFWKNKGAILIGASATTAQKFDLGKYLVAAADGNSNTGAAIAITIQSDGSLK